VTLEDLTWSNHPAREFYDVNILTKERTENRNGLQRQQETAEMTVEAFQWADPPSKVSYLCTSTEHHAMKAYWGVKV
jgi:hypothetical protein